MSYNIVLGGVGGQGLMTVAEVLAEAAHSLGYNVKIMKYKGLAQRGGSIRAYVRIGEVYSPIVPESSANVVLSFELSETLNVERFVGEDTIVVVLDYKVPSILNILGVERYPEEIKEEFIAKGYYVLPGEEDAKKYNIPVISLNSYMVGAFSVIAEDIIPDETLREVLFKRLRRFREENMKAYKLGRERMKEIIMIRKEPQ